MRERSKLLLEAADREDWSAVGEVYIELALEAGGRAAEFHIEAPAPNVRGKDADKLRLLVKEILRIGPSAAKAS